MAKRRMFENKLGRTGEAEVQLVGWGSSLLNEATNSSPRQGTEQWPRAWDRPEPNEPNHGDQEKQQLQERVAQIMARNDRRHHPRLAQAAEIRIQQLSPPLMTPANMVSADVQNLSRGGICIASRLPLVTSSVVRCQIGMPDLRFAIPSLLQVVWLERTGASEYSVGLRYLL